MSLTARQELLAVTALRYQAVSRREKQPILNEFVAATGYHRKYAINLLKGYPRSQAAPTLQRPGRQRVYTADVQAALVQVWEVASRICSKRLVPFLPDLIEALERHGHLTVTTEVKARLLSISAATVDRLLAPVRQADQVEDQRRAERSAFLKQQVPIRTYSEWNEAQPGYVEADLVAHCGGDVSGSYIHTLVMTDVVSGWTECIALLFRDQQMVLQGVRQGQAQLPVPLLALDTDNGTEFLNGVLFDYCTDQPIIFTRSRPYKKNDQCYVEQKNGVIVRQFVGYDRLEGVEPSRILTELYRYLRLYVNFFQPSLKLIAKERVGSRVIKKYDLAQTPYQRLLAADSVSAEIKAQLKAQFQTLDPLWLLTQIQTLQDELWAYANVNRDTTGAKPALKYPLASPDVQLSLPQGSPDKPLAGVTLGVNGNGVVHSGQKPSNLSSSEVLPERPQRRYRRSKQPRRVYQGVRYWRTRPDPFAEVWDELQHQLAQRPDLSAHSLFESLQQQYPGQFTQGQLRTLQRRVRAWRLAYMTSQEELSLSEPSSL